VFQQVRPESSRQLTNVHGPLFTDNCPLPASRRRALYQGASSLPPQPAHPFFKKSSTRRSRDQTSHRAPAHLPRRLDALYQGRVYSRRNGLKK